MNRDALEISIKCPPCIAFPKKLYHTLLAFSRVNFLRGAMAMPLLSFCRTVLSFVISPHSSPFCHFDRSVVFSLALAQNRGFCAKEERQRSEVASRIYAACLERSLARRAKRRNLGAPATDKRGRPSFIVRFLDFARNDREGWSTERLT